MCHTRLTRQALPEKEYIVLLGIALTVFASNNSFVIENILRKDRSKSWYKLIDKKVGEIKKIAKGKLPDDIVNLFDKIIHKRNRIIHGFQITDKNGKQILATKVIESGEQFYITEKYLIDFIKQNEKLNDLLHSYREKFIESTLTSNTDENKNISSTLESK